MKGFVLARTLLLVVAAGASLLAPPVGSLAPILAALAVAALASLALLAVPLRGGSLRTLAQALLVTDTALVTFLVYLTGWAGSPFLPLTFAAVLGAAFLLSPAAAVVHASGMVLALCVVTGFYRAAALQGTPPPLLPAEASTLWDRNLSYYLGHLLLETGALYAVAILGGILVLRLSREQILLKEVLDLMGEGVIATDARGCLLVTNAEAHRCLRLSPGDVGSPLAPALPPDIAAWLVPALASESPLQMRQTVSPAVGPTLPLSVQVSPLIDGRGRRGTVILVTDLTREREAAAVARRAERLEATARLSMGIAHEIRNPLASIRGAAQELAKAPDPRLSAMILGESDRLDRILGDFLAYARLAPPRPVRCDLAAVVSETAALARERTGARGISWELPEGNPMPVEADPGQLRQLFLNLIINALQAMNGSGTLSIRLAPAARAGTDGFLATVSDTGPGVAPEAVDRLFEPFFTTKPEGTGLGLALAARVAAAHGGEVRLAGPGPGARFEVWLPARPVEGALHA